MKVNIPKHFVDEVTQHLIGRGERDVATHTAQRWIAKGKAEPADEGSAEYQRELEDNRPKEIPGGGDDNVVTGPAAETFLPEDFPERDKLIAAGLDTVEKLKAKDAADKIGAVEGISKAGLTKIGLAIDKI